MHQKARGLVNQTCKQGKKKSPFTEPVKEGQKAKGFNNFMRIVVLGYKSQGGVA